MKIEQYNVTIKCDAPGCKNEILAEDIETHHHVELDDGWIEVDISKWSMESEKQHGFGQETNFKRLKRGDLLKGKYFCCEDHALHAILKAFGRVELAAADEKLQAVMAAVEEAKADQEGEDVGIGGKTTRRKR